jgi:hypothetical protein
VNCWINKRVTLNDSWGAGAAHSLKTPLGQQPEFSLHPRYLRDAQGNPQLAHFSIDFPSGFLSDGWQGVTFTPLGTIAVAGITGLPAWDPSQRDTYRRVIDGAAVSLGDSRTLRLEAVIPYLAANGGVGYNKVRLFYAFGAVKGGHVADLVVVKIATHAAAPGTVQASQDGSGQGPPH